MALKDVILLLVCLLGFAGIALAIFKLAGSVKEREDPPVRNQAAPANNGPAVPGLRRRNRAANGEAGEGEDEEDDEGDENEPDYSNMSKKDIAKHEKRRAKAAARQQEEAYREERREREEKRMEALRERELQKEKEFEMKQQEVERLRKIEEKRLADAYNAWKDPVSVEGSEGLLENIASYVIEKQIVSIETIAKDFSLPVYICVKTVEKLIENRRIVASINGDGNVICLSDDISKLCSNYIQEHGRVDKDNLRQHLNKSIMVVHPQ